MTARTRLLVLLVSAPVFAFAVIGGFLGKAMARDDTYSHLRVFEEVLQLVTSNYVEEVNTTKLLNGAMHGLADSLDPDSAFLLPAQARTQESGEALPAGDVGIDLTRQYYLRVIAARDSSPAAKAGLRAGDFVRIIDKQPTRETSVWEGVHALRGKPGSMVTLTVIRGNAADPHVVELTREALTPLPATGRAIGNGVGYLRVPEFRDQTPDDLKARMAELTRGGATRFVIDLRSTARGSLANGLAAARLFVGSGPLAILDTRGRDRLTISAGSGDGSLKQPMALLTDEGTSGAAELFAAALAGNKRAELIGNKTHGRAALQKIVKLPDASALWMSYAWYLTPAAAPIHEKGIVPNVEVETPDVEFGAAPPTKDPVLDKAVERLTMKAAA